MKKASTSKLIGRDIKAAAWCWPACSCRGAPRCQHPV